MHWRCGDRVFDLEAGPLVMGILNVTPDSFSDGGRYFAPEAAVARGRQLVEEGAALLDLGGESTRPGSAPVEPEEQWRRIAPVLEELAKDSRVTLSVDTASAWVAERALKAGAMVVNDVTALRDPRMPEVVRNAQVGLVLMHMRGTPADMQRDPRYQDPASEVADWLAVRMRGAVAAGIARDAIALDPGIGFGKTVAHNLRLLAGLDRLAALDRPVVVGVSRKSFLGKLLDEAPVDGRLEGGLAAAAVAVFQGASVVRTHDVAATLRAVRLAAALRSHS
jgi:dihydropteroate synthase